MFPRQSGGLHSGFMLLAIHSTHGRYDETFEIVTWRQLGLHEKPIVLVNIDEYWDPLLLLLKRMAHENYIPHREDEFYSVVSSIQDILPTVHLMPPVQTKLINK